MDQTTTVPCTRCGYLLHELTASDRCPECGLPARWSIGRPAALAEYPPKWIRKMAAASMLLLLATVLIIVLFLVGNYAPRYFPRDGTWLLWTFVVPVSLALWMLSQRSGHWTEPPQRSVRWPMKIIAVILPLLVASYYIVLYYTHRYQILEYLSFASVLVNLSLPIYVILRLRILTRIIGDPALVEYCTIVLTGWAIIVVFVVILVLSEKFGWFRQFTEARHGMFEVLFPLVLSVALGLFVLWSAFILLACVISLFRAMKMARATAADWKRQD